MKHSGIWWARQKGIKGLGNPEYRHQFFTRREAEYMGKQFAKAAKKDLIAAGKNFGIAAVGFIAGEGTRFMVNYLSIPGQNNRDIQVKGAYTSGILTGAAGGMMAGAAGGAMMGGSVGPHGAAIGAIVGGVLGVLKGIMGGMETQIGFRNEDIINENNKKMAMYMRHHQRSYSMSDMALQNQMNLMPSRSGKLSLIKRQLDSIQNGPGDETIQKLEMEENAMLHGLQYNGHQYKKGDISTERGKYVQNLLQQLYSRREALNTEYMQISMSKPHAKPIDAVTDDYSRRGLYAGGQVSVQDVNTIIVDKMKTIIGLLEGIRKNSSTDMNIREVLRVGPAQW